MLGCLKKRLRHTADWVYRHYFASRVEHQICHHFMMSNHIFGGPESRVSIAETAGVLGVFCNVSSGNISVEDYASISHGTMLVTGSHDIAQYDRERQEAYPEKGRDIVVRRGAWICSGAIVLGPCVIGEHAVVAAGAVVNKDVPPYAVVAGVPARVIRKIAKDEVDTSTESSRLG